MKKVLVIILLILMMPLVLYGCPRVLRISGMVHESLLKQQIFRFVYENEDALTAVAEGQIAGTNQDKRFGKAEIEGVYDGKQPIVQFYWDGIGIAPSSAYFGFYYAPDDKPALMDNVDGVFYPRTRTHGSFQTASATAAPRSASFLTGFITKCGFKQEVKSLLFCIDGKIWAC